MRLRGREIISATICPLPESPLLLGSYVGISSLVQVELLSLGLLVDAVPEAKAALALGRFIAATLSKSASFAYKEEVFVPIHLPITIDFLIYEKREMTPINYVDKNLRGYWLPMILNSSSDYQRSGWMRLSECVIEILTVNDLKIEEEVSIKPIYSEQLEFRCKLVSKSKRWEYSPILDK